MLVEGEEDSTQDGKMAAAAATATTSFIFSSEGEGG
jgi:hypothetical protein